MNDTRTETKPTEIQMPPAVADLPAVADRHEKVVEKAERKAARKPRETDSIANIAGAIADITAEVGVIAKAGFNQFHRYKFAQMQDVLQRLTPLIAKHGLVIVQTETSRNMLDDGRAVAVEYEFTIAHKSGEMWPDRPRQTGLCRCRDSKGGFDDKAFNKCHTAARKYFLLALFQIATGDEDDADTHDTGGRYSGEVSTPTKVRPPKPAPNVMREEVDPFTGEVEPKVEEGMPEAITLEGLARLAAGKGEKDFRDWWKKRSKDEREQLAAIGDDLREILEEAKQRGTAQ